MSSHMRYASVCDGIGAAHVAWQPLGWECAWTSEIEPFPAAVVDHHWRLKNLGDMTKLTEEMLNECGPISLLCGGTPCQSFSVAGLRKGLEDPRGNLALRFTQLVGVLRPEWVVWENVPGVLSSGEGRDFGTFLGALAELGYGFAYRVLDAQWFGVAQRRRRVFVVGHFGDWRRAAAVLFERESLCGNPPTRGKAWEGVAGAVTARFGRNGGSANNEIDGNRLVAFHPTQDPISSVDGSTHAMGCGSKGGCCTQAVAVRTAQTSANGHGVAADVCHTLDRVQGQAVAFKPSHFTRGKDGAPADVVAPLSADADKGDQDTVVAQGFTYSGYSNQPAWMTGDRTDCLPASGHSDGSHQGVGVVCGDGDTVGTIRSNTRNNSDPVTEAAMHVMHGMAVRRLTPRECERLQGFPDGYTDVTYRGKPAADGPRYRALGNSMAVPVMAWIGKRIAMLEEATDGTQT